jgi:S1-C subfamily serine protease
MTFLLTVVLTAGAIHAQSKNTVAPAPTGRSANVGVVAAQSAPPRKDIPAIAKAANGVIVSIITSDKDGHPVAQGTGFLVSNDGRIVTNYHVIKGAHSAIVKLPDGAFYDVDGVVAFDKVRDLAVIKAHGQNFRVVTLGNSDRVQVGEAIVAIGSPLSLESTVSSGIISGIRSVEEKGGKFLQVTAPISPGSSGGPLFNMAGEVVGITTLYIEGGENLNFAIPINDAKRLLSANSKVQDFPVETSDPLANLGTPATPNAAPPNREGKTPLKFISRDLGIYTFVTGNLIIKATCVGTVDEYHPDVQPFCNLGLPGTVYLPSLYPGTFKVVGDATHPDDYFQLAGTYYQLDTMSLSLDTEGECSTLTDPAEMADATKAGTDCGPLHAHFKSSTIFSIISIKTSDK